MTSSSVFVLCLLAGLHIDCSNCSPLDNGDSVRLSEEYEINKKIMTPNSNEKTIHKRSNRYQDDSIVFPDELPERYEESRIIPENPICADEKEFCETVDGYPEEYISKVLSKKLSKFEGMFGTWINEVQDLPLNHKFGDPSVEQSLCYTMEEHVSPRAIKGPGKWLYVINQDNYTQTFLTEQCVSNNLQSDCHRIGLDYESKCVQKHSRMKLVVLENGEPTLKEFTVPSCCACMLDTRKPKFASRIADSYPISPAFN